MNALIKWLRHWRRRNHRRRDERRPSPSGFRFDKMRMAGPHHPVYAFRRLTLILLAVLVAAGAGTAGDGSLWTRDSAVNYQFKDYMPRRVGDVVTILIVENSSASDDASTDVSKKSSISGTIGDVLEDGAKILGKAIPFDIFKFQSDNSYEGEGSTERSNRVTARIAAKVKRVEPNGNLLLEGRRSIVIGKDRKDIIITGEVSSYSVTRDNTVLSTDVADAQITYSGTGPVNNAGNPTIFHRILDVIPFF